MILFPEIKQRQEKTFLVFFFIFFSVMNVTTVREVYSLTHFEYWKCHFKITIILEVSKVCFQLSEGLGSSQPLFFALESRK